MHVRKLLLVLFLPIFISGLYVALLKTLYTSPFDREYFNDLYDHSQYSIAQSTRQIGDGGVYQTIGDRLVQGKAGVFTVDPQVPPLGKTLIGLSIQYFGNGYVLNIVTAILCGWCIFALAYLLTSSFKRSLLAMLLFMLDPLIASQFKETMLDMIQLCALLIHCVVLLIATGQTKSLLKVCMFLIAGMCLGLFASIKFGLLAPIIVLVDCMYIGYLYHRKARAWSNTLKAIIVPMSLMMGGAIIGLLIGHAPFFLQGGSLIQFLKNEKWLVSFWSMSNTTAFIGVPVATLLIGSYHHFTKTAPWVFIEEWHLLWTVYGVSLVLMIRKAYQGRFLAKPETLYIIFLTVCMLGFYSVLPFYYRYFVLLIPFLICIFVITVGRPSWGLKVVYVVAGVILVARLTMVFFETPEGVIVGMQRHFSAWTFQDAYSNLLGVTETRPRFWERTYRFQFSAHSKSNLQIQPTFTYPWQTNIAIPYTLTYETKAGALAVNGNMEFRRMGHAWYLVWKDTYLYPEYTLGDTLILETSETAREGRLLKPDGSIALGPVIVPYVRLYPDRIQDEARVLRQLEKLTGLSQYKSENIYKANHVPQIPVEIGKVVDGKAKTIDKVMLESGIELFYKREYPPVPIAYAGIVPTEGQTLYIQKHDGTKV